MKKLILLVFSFVGLILISGWLFFFIKNPQFISPLKSLNDGLKVDYTPYAFENLKNRRYFKSEIKLEEVLEENESFISYLFSFSSEGRRITGMAHLPQKEGPLPVVILLRGWVDEEIYQTGLGTKKMADFLARDGFITLAPDFLGYGGSDPAFADMLLTRFFRPITVITLLDSLESLPQADSTRVAMWGHSNGGQIALSVLEITEREIPTSLWAPVSAAFPESILYFADEMADEGKLLRKIIADFEKEYHFSDYSTTNYYQQIKTSLIIHQGLTDESIPAEWNDELAESLGRLGKEVTDYRYPGENHNFTRGSAPIARERDLKFFKDKLGLN